MKDRLQAYWEKSTEAAPLAVFRILFGLILFISMVRFYANGWIEKFYLTPVFNFSYYGFEWVKPLGLLTYGLFGICAIAALMVCLGYRYRLASVLLFFSFTYIELMDKTTYLNHYYFVSIISFLMIFLPANRYFSLDAYQKTSLRSQYIPQWSVDTIRFMLCIVYFYAGLAKLNSDWLLEAMPLKIWLPSKYDIPLLGEILQQTWAHYAFSWAGAIYDLSIPFLLVYRPTQKFAFVLVVAFHLMTGLLFPIGIFPYLMIAASLIFFPADFHHRLLSIISGVLRTDMHIFRNQLHFTISSPVRNRLMAGFLVVFFAIQIAVPFRYLMYPGELFWTEEGFRFSWRVMLMEKAGYATFKIVDPQNQRWFYVDNGEFLSPFQEKQMATQPDFILEYAHFLKKFYQQKGIPSPEVYVESYVALNGRRSQPFIDPKADLTQIHDSFLPKTWILPFADEIKGL